MVCIKSGESCVRFGPNWSWGQSLETREEEAGCQDGLGDRDGEIAWIGVVDGDGRGSRDADGISDEDSSEWPKQPVLLPCFALAS